MQTSKEVANKPESSNNLNKTPESLSKPKNNVMKQPAQIKHHNINTQVDMPFHRRQCYLTCHRADRFRTAKLPISKTIQFVNKDLLQRPASERTYVTETVNLADSDTPRMSSNEEESDLESTATKPKQKEHLSKSIAKTRRCTSYFLNMF